MTREELFEPSIDAPAGVVRAGAVSSQDSVGASLHGHRYPDSTRGRGDAARRAAGPTPAVSRIVHQVVTGQP
jgi:hypothetical protein